MLDRNEKDRRFQTMFGMSAADMEEVYAVSNDEYGYQVMTESAFGSDPRTYAMSILSDAQETLENGDVDRAMQLMNRAKYVLGESLKLNRKIKAT